MKTKEKTKSAPGGKMELNVYTAAKQAGVSHQRLLRAIAAGYIRARRVNVDRVMVFVDPGEVAAYLKNPPNRGPKPAKF